MVPTLWFVFLLSLGMTVVSVEAWERCPKTKCDATKPTDPQLVWPGLGWYQSNCQGSCLFDGWPSALCDIAGPCCQKVALAQKAGSNISTATDFAFFCGVYPCDKNWYYDAKYHMCSRCPECTITTINNPDKLSDCVPDPKCNQPPIDPKKPPSQLKLSFNGMECMKGHEGFCQNCYLDTKCKWTIGFGFLQESQASCAKLAPMSISQANSLFDQKIVEYEGYVKKYIKVNLTQGQYDALVDMAYNMGPKFSKSDTVKFVNNEQFSQAIARLRSVTGDEGPRRWHEADLFESNYSKCPKYLGFVNKLCTKVQCNKK